MQTPCEGQVTLRRVKNQPPGLTDLTATRHDAARQKLHAGKLGDAPDNVDKPRAFILVKEVRAVGAS